MHTVIIKLTLSINFRKVNKQASDPNEYLTQCVCVFEGQPKHRK